MGAKHSKSNTAECWEAALAEESTNRSFATERATSLSSRARRSSECSAECFDYETYLAARHNSDRNKVPLSALAGTA